MKTSNKIAIVAVGLIAIGIIGSLATYKKAEADPFELVETANAPFSSIKVNASNAKITIKKAEGNTAKAVLTGNEKTKGKIKFKSRISNNEWIISAADSNFFSFSFDFMSDLRRLTIYLPEQDYDKLFVQTDNGRISFQALTAQTIRAEADNGRIDIQKSAAKQIEARTSNGRITLTDTTGEVHARTDNGRIDYDSETISDNLDLATDNGRIQIDLLRKPEQLQLDARTDNGRITIFGQQHRNNTNYETSKDQDEKSGPTVKLRTDNGRIDVNAQSQ